MGTINNNWDLVSLDIKIIAFDEYIELGCASSNMTSSHAIILISDYCC